jgi:hypothetical protein
LTSAGRPGASGAGGGGHPGIAALLDALREAAGQTVTSSA